MIMAEDRIYNEYEIHRLIDTRDQSIKYVAKGPLGSENSHIRPRQSLQILGKDLVDNHLKYLADHKVIKAGENLN